jgi:hypothetical protein
MSVVLTKAESFLLKFDVIASDVLLERFEELGQIGIYVIGILSRRAYHCCTRHRSRQEMEVMRQEAVDYMNISDMNSVD